MASDGLLKDILERAEKQGWKIEATKKKHIKLTPPGPGPIVIVAGSMSDYRAIDNTLARMRRQGFNYPR